MQLNNNFITDLKITYIDWGSKELSWKLMADLALENQISRTMVLFDIDTKVTQENTTVGKVFSQQPDAVSHWEYKFEDNIDRALTDANFEILSILPGSFEEMLWNRKKYLPGWEL